MSCVPLALYYRPFSYVKVLPGDEKLANVWKVDDSSEWMS